jgi:predicted MPP superfamily phosphohydrolase
MVEKASRRFEKIITNSRNLFLAVVIAGIILPLTLIIWLAVTQGTIDNILYGALRLPYVFFVLIILAILIMAIVALSKYSRYPGRIAGLMLATMILAVICILLTIGLSFYIAVPYFSRSNDTPPQLVVSGSPDDSGIPSIYLTFWTETPTQNTIEYGISNGSGHFILREDQPVNRHWFQLVDLEPGEKYYYSVNGGKHSEFMSFPNEGEKIRFAAAGDSHFGKPGSHNDLTNTMLGYIRNPANDYSMFFMLGDCVDLGFMDRQWKQAFNEISSCSSTVPICYVAGNHDTLFGGLDLYKTYLCPPQYTAENENCLWKRIDIGDVHFIVLDVEWSEGLFTPCQRQWLLEQLEDIPAEDWCIVMSHAFYYCSGAYIDGWAWYDNEQTITSLTPIFEQYDVDIVMSGHKHQAEVLQVNDVTYVVLGCFGSPPDPEREYISAGSVWYGQGFYGFADIAVDENEALITIRDSDNTSVFQTAVQR